MITARMTDAEMNAWVKAPATRAPATKAPATTVPTSRKTPAAKAPAANVTTETIRMYDTLAGEWREVEVAVTPEPRRRRRRTVRRATSRRGAPRDLTGLSDGSPIPPWWRDTAYAEMGPLADTRTWVKPSAMKTRRAATVMPADPGRITETGRRD